MAVLWASGAELQSVANTVEFSAIITNAPAVETTTKRSGNAAFRLSNGAAIEGFRQIHTAAQGSFFFQFYLRIVAMPTNTRFIGGARTTVNKVVIRLSSAGVLSLWNAEDSAQVGADSSALSTGTWYRIALNYNSTTLASTTVEAKAFADTPGAAAFWNPSGTIDLAATPTGFGAFIDAADATLDYIVDDLTINDTTATAGPVNWNTWPPENNLIILRPNGNGDNSDWGGSDGNSTDNYLLIDEVPPDSADYVEDNTSGQIDDYNLEATPAAMGSGDTINAVLVGGFVAVSDASAGDPDMVFRFKASASGTVEESASLDVNSITFHAPAPLPADDNYKLVLYDMPGASTTAITKADLDVSQAGVREAVTDTHFVRLAALWVYVSFTPSTGGTTFNQSVSGTQTTAGALALRTGKPVAGTVTSAGAVLMRTGKVLAGTLTSSGVVTTIKLALVALAGTLTSAGVVLARANKALSGALTPAGTLVLSARKALSGVLASAGTLANRTGKALAGTLTSSGVVTTIKLAIVALSGTLTSAGTVVKQTGKALGGTLTSSGTVVRAIALHLAGSLGLAGYAAKRMALALSGTLSFIGTLAAQMVGPVAFYMPGTRDVRRARDRGELLSDAPGRQAARSRGDLKSEG